MSYIRKTRDYFELQGNYGYGHGWECLTAELTIRAARDQRKCYRENEPGTPTRIVKKREPIDLAKEAATREENKQFRQRRFSAAGMKAAVVAGDLPTSAMDKRNGK